MEKKSKFIYITFTCLFAFSIWHFVLKEKDKSQQALLWEQQKGSYMPKSISQNAPEVEYSGPAYKRKKIRRPLLKREISEISTDLTNFDNVKAIAERIKNRPMSVDSDFDFSHQPEWDLNKLPSSHEDYLSLVEEAKIKSLNLLVDSSIVDDYSGVRKAIASYTAMSIMGEFYFKGYDEKGNLLLELPDDYISQNKKRRDSYAKKMKQSRSRKVANNVKDSIDGTEEVSLEALFQEKLEQSTYFADLDSPDKRSDKYWGGDKNLFDGVTEAVDYLVNAIANLDVFYTPPKGIHQSNIDVINDTIRDLSLRPHEYNVSGQVSDATDLDFEVLAEAVVRKVALHHGILGSTFTTVFGRTLVDKIQNARIFAAGVLVTVGVESVFAALGCYWGNIRLIMLHRYHAYIKDAKAYYKRNNIDFIIGDIPPFNPERVYHAETTRIELNKSWLWGFGLGTLVKQVINKDVMTRAGTSIALWAMENSASSRLVIRWSGKLISALSIGMVTSFGELFAKIATLPMAGVKWAGKVIGFFKKAFALTPATVVAYVLDFTFTAAAIYSVIHTKLHASTIMLDRIYYAPDMAIHLTQQNWSDGKVKTGPEAFLKSTRQLFYPLCYYLASTDMNSQKMTRYSDSKSTEGQIDQNIRLQKHNCIQIMAAFEGVKPERLHTHFEKLVDSGDLDKKVYDSYYGKSSFQLEEVGDYIVKMHTSYPEYYKIIWIAGLKSIFHPNHLPEGFYGFKNLIVSGHGGDRFEDYNSYFDFSTHKQAERINILRFEYIIEKLAYRAKTLRVESEKSDTNQPINLTEAFIVYWKYHTQKTKEFNAEVYELLREKERGFFGLIWDGIKASYDNIRWIVRRWKASPYELTYNYKMELEIDDVIEKQKEDCVLGLFWCSQ